VSAAEIKQLDSELRMTKFDPKVMQGTSDLHDHVGEASLDVAEGVLKYPTTLDASNGMFDIDASTGEDPIQPFVNSTQFLAFGLFFG
jgi:hypothetical protein